MLRQVYVSRLRLTPKVLRTAPTGTFAQPPEVAFGGAWNYVHEDQDQHQDEAGRSSLRGQFGYAIIRFRRYARAGAARNFATSGG
ncbi:hypothetical protein EMIT053CA3_150087 [Pseudomonas donghuensis]